ncbi:GGDEF and EAL domain-containing protein [Candidatus Xianfuyuplasma coldseepsis]|uniref:GGDEF and EAL domain-containing protein n=1 Tax=Candidatus Xianfuyuplasma coldseepsis TaxID=2782163 RepID=A0A7L7KQ37_9MOLU|nr:GGDEF and EAL domain-containing protein [Xianfuyuplasma coldseepsis]QMS84549.1 GGDEF and EAL domain-containing protein [Xianfuyuplasma coldseepsis]
MNFFGYLKRDKLIRETLIFLVLLWVLISLMFWYGIRLYSQINYNSQQESTYDMLEHHAEDLYNTSISFQSFVLSSENITLEEFQQYWSYLSSHNSEIDYVTYAPAGVIEYASPVNYMTEFEGVDLIQSFSVSERADFVEAQSNSDMFVIFDENNNYMTIHTPIMDEDEFVGLFSVHYNLDEYLNKLYFTNEKSDVRLLLEDHELLSGTGDFREELMLHVHGLDFTLSTNYTNDQYSMLHQSLIIIMSASFMTFGVIFFLVFNNQKRMSEYMAYMEYSEAYSLTTDLKNRNSLVKDFNHLASTTEGFYFAYGVFNNIKFINYKYGYVIGEGLVKEAIRLISGVIREGTEMYHLGGDEYAFLLNSTMKAEVRNILQRVLRVFDRDIVIKKIRTNISLSLGVVYYPTQGQTMEELIKNAHLALSQSSIINSNNFAFFDKRTMSDLIGNQDFDIFVSKLQLTNFDTYMMPMLDVTTNKIVGFECLSRAFNEFNEMLDTGAIVNSLERSGRIEELDVYVFQRVLTYMKELNIVDPKNDLFLSVNVSALSFNDSFVQRVIKLFKESKLNHGTIVLELTESYKVEDYDYLIRLFKRLDRAGIKTAIDDFGSGYSSISYISKFPIYMIKVDKAYVRDYEINEFNRTLFLTLQSIVKVLECRMVAEGVDDPETLDFLRENDGEWYQGFLYSKGVPFEEAVKMYLDSKTKKIK